MCWGHCLPCASQLTDHTWSWGRSSRMLWPLSLPDGTRFAGQDGNVGDKAWPRHGGQSRCLAHRLDQEGSFTGTHKDVGPSGRDMNLNRASWQIQQKPPFRHFQKLCPHTSEGRLRTQGHSCAATYRAVNNAALQARARTAQDNGVASTRDKNYSKHLVTVLLCEAEKHILIQRV